jgi:hypothetical protein
MRDKAPWDEGSVSEVPGCDTLGAMLAAIRRPQQAGRPVALLVVSVGGHAPGDAASAALCRRLRASVRASDPLCWLGGGYGVMLLGATPSEATTAAARVGRALSVSVTVVTLAPGVAADDLVGLCAEPGEKAPSPPIPLFPLVPHERSLDAAIP